jgi:hypothetical protein
MHRMIVMEYNAYNEINKIEQNAEYKIFRVK